MSDDSNTMRRLDFSPGIKAEDIQFDLDLLETRQDRERLRTGGYGMVEGFEMTNKPNFQIGIGEGIFINHQGQEVIVPENTLTIAKPDYIDITEQVTVDDQGEIHLRFAPYSPARIGLIDTDYYNSVYPNVELVIADAGNAAAKIKAIRVYENTLIVDANRWANQSVNITYKYSRNRIDTILMDKDGLIHVEQGISSTSPSHVDLSQFAGYMVVGLAEVQIATNTTIQLYNLYRTYRKVYVNENNVLYLNGKPYVDQKFIYFEEPASPVPNDIWYDGVSNTLLIWKQENGVWGWVAVNDRSTRKVTEVKLFDPEQADYPADTQTFQFSEEEINLYFVPGQNELQIIIDNNTLMEDQFTEIIMPGSDGKDYLSTGIGFKLRDPLDRPTFVEVRVNHSIQTAPLKKTFQRAAVFVDENFSYFNSLNTNKVFDTTESYVIGEDQLEVFVNGRRLDTSVDFEEVLDAATAPSDADKGKASKCFKVLIALTNGDRVSYKITKHVWSYDHLDQMVDEIETRANDAYNLADQCQTEINTLNTNLNNEFNAINTNITSLSNEVAGMSNYVKKTDVLDMKNLPVAALGALFGGAFYQTAAAGTATYTIPGVKTTDFLLVFYMNAEVNRILIGGVDYTTVQQGNDLLIALNNTLVDSSSTLYITGIKFGVAAS